MGDSAAGATMSAANAPEPAPTDNAPDTRTPHANDASRVPRTPCPPLLGDAFPRQAFLFGVQKSSVVGRLRTIPMSCCNFITPFDDPRQRRQLLHVGGIMMPEPQGRTPRQPARGAPPAVGAHPHPALVRNPSPTSRDPDRAGRRPSMTVSSFGAGIFGSGHTCGRPRRRSSAVIGRLNWTFWAEMPRLVFTRVAIGLLQLLGHLLFILASAPGGPVGWPGLDQSYA